MTNQQTKRVCAVAVQSFLYAVGFVLCYAWTLAIRILESFGFDGESEASIFPLLVLQACFSTLQGFINLFIFARPTYLRVRVDFPHK
jgi:uncharacterized membrane protein YozB (DUF420 family)